MQKMTRTATEEQKSAELKDKVQTVKKFFEEQRHRNDRRCSKQFNSSRPRKKPERLQQRKPRRRLLRERPKLDNKQTRQKALAKTTAEAENVSRRTVNEQFVIKRQMKSGVRQFETTMSSQCSAYRRAGVEVVQHVTEHENHKHVRKRRQDDWRRTDRTHRVGVLLPMPPCLCIGGHTGGSLQGHPRYTSALTVGRPWVARNKLHATPPQRQNQGYRDTPWLPTCWVVEAWVDVLVRLRAVGWACDEDAWECGGPQFRLGMKGRFLVGHRSTSSSLDVRVSAVRSADRGRGQEAEEVGSCQMACKGSGC